MFIELNYQPMLEDFNKKMEMEYPAILKLLENAGSQHSEKAGDNNIEAANAGISWVLTDWYVEILELPKMRDIIKVLTWTEPLSSPFNTLRDFELFANAKLVLKGLTRWALFDLVNKRPAKITDDLMNRYGAEDRKVFENFKIPKIAMPETFTSEKEIAVRRSDIDFNDHVHNLVYFDYAMETLPEELYENRNYHHIHIAYKMPVFKNEKITCKHAVVEDKHIFCVYGDNDVLKTQIELY